MRELDDQVFSDVVLREVHRRSAFGRVAGQIDRAVKTVRAPDGDLLQGTYPSGDPRHRVPEVALLPLVVPVPLRSQSRGVPHCKCL
ncbi:hypothetical protein ACTHRK_02815 [Dietzia cercidiphylli]|uniref:hypothetical protein n=1 Tax=Dietzia cercidiphylli TaxID=498199 RepID=UPI003F7EFA3B